MDAFEKYWNERARSLDEIALRTNIEQAFRAGMKRAAEIANEPEPECCGKPDIDRRDGSQSCCGSPDPRPRTADEIFTAILAEADK